MTKTPVLLAGLPRGHPIVVNSPMAKSGMFDPVKVAQELTDMEEEVSKTGYELEFFQTAPEDGIQTWVDKLKEKEWKAIVIGYGVRGNPEVTEFFEQLVNVAHKEAPQAVFCFNTRPSTTLASLERNLPL